MARAAIIQLSSEHDDIIPLIWQMSDPNSPGANQRYEFYAGEAYPFGIFGGESSFTGEDGSYDEYLEIYQQLSGQETPWNMDLEFAINDEGNYLLTAHINLEENVVQDSLRMFFALTRHDESNYSSLVLGSAYDQPLELSQAGESISIQKIFAAADYYENTSLRGIAIIQNITSREVLQAVQTPVTQLIPQIQVNLDSGPASLGIHFQNTSFPVEGLTSWQWDFQNDGIIDSEEENPYFVYNDPGVYDVRLVISDGDTSSESIFNEYITVTDTDEIEGTVVGIWRQQFSPYTITDDISIPYYGELMIEPGTQIIAEDNIRINVYGRLAAEGTEDSPVVFSSPETWKGIKFLNTLENNILQHTHLINANLSAVNVSYSSLEIHNSLFQNNVSGSLGAAINLLGCDDVLITGSRIFNNSSSMTGGIAMRSSHPVLINNIFANNEGSMAGALVIREDSDPVLINNIISHNYAPVAAIFVDESTPEFVNNILQDEQAVFLGDIDQMRINYTISSHDIPGDDNITADPLFILPPAGSGMDFAAIDADWHLQNISPAIDAGNPDSDYNDPEDPFNPGFALFPALGTITNDIGAYGGTGVIPETVPNDEDIINPAPAISLTAYPNPFTYTSQRGTVNFVLDGAQGGELEIFNIRGQKIYQESLEPQQTNIFWQPKSLSAKQLPAGVYLSRWKSKEQQTTNKFIIIK